MQQRTPKRPVNVPVGARWVEPLWQYGTTDARGAAQGLWCGWKKKGALAYVAHLVDDAVEGATVEFHPDGGLYRRATYSKGKLVGIEEIFAPTKKSDEAFPAEKPVARVTVEHGPRGETKRQYFLSDGAECNAHGTPLSALMNDTPFLVREPELFAKTLALYTKHRIKMAPGAAFKAKAAAQPGLTKNVAALWGAKVRGPQKLALAMLERAKIPKHIGSLRIEPLATLCAQEAGATAESVIVRGQRSVSGLPIVALLSGILPFAVTADNGIFALSLYDDDESAVYAWTEEPRDLFLDSDDFATFLLLRAAEEAHAGGMLSPRAAAHVARLFSSHVRETSIGTTRWAASAFDEKETNAQARHRRGIWLASLLAGKPVDVVRAHFEREGAAPLDRALVARLGRPELLNPPDLVYALLRSQLAGDARLPSLLDVADKSRATLVSSTGALVRAMVEGRNKLGTLKDLGALSRALRPLFL